MEEVPFDDRHVPRVEIEWERSVWWWHALTRAIHPAMRMSSLVLGLGIIVLIVLGVEVGEWIFSPAWRPTSLHLASPGENYLPPCLQWGLAVFQSLTSFRQLGLKEVAFISFELIWLTLVLSMFGGILARRSLVELGQRTVAPWGESARIVGSRWQSYLWSTGMHLVGIFAMLIPFLLLGLLSRLGEVSANITGALVLLCFPIVFGIGRFAVSTFVCFPLSVCAISAEKRADAFEGFSRSNAYFFQRPVVAFACVLCLFLAGLVGEQIVYWTITLGWWLARSTFLDSGGLVQPAAGKFVNLGDALAAALIAAYWASYFWSASAAIYLILRKAIDNTELDELDSIQSPQERALPQLASAPSASSAVAGMSSTHTTTDSEPAAGEAKERSLDDED